MKKKLTTEEMAKKLKKIEDSEDPLSDLVKNLEVWQKEWTESPVYKRELLRRKKMKDFKKKNPLTKLLAVGPCKDCVISSTCNQSFFDGSACRKYMYALRKFLKDKGYYKNGGREKTN